ncbi:MAG: penicillin-binding protein activator LpoB [Oligoflexales bacterium]|nr:penicillin-binding protein activator LpoB [Oligoflexales bacterium]
MKIELILGRWVTGFSILAGISACTPAFQGEYDDPNKREIVDDKWNESDAKKTAEVMVNDALKKSWLDKYKRMHKGERPVVIVDDVENRTDEHIDTVSLTDYIQDELINSGEVRFVDKKRRQKILDEIKYQHGGEVAKSTAKERGRQTGADYMMAGAISSSVHTQEGLKTVYYQVNLTLTDLESSEFVWSSKHEIKKRFNRSGSKW